MLCFPNAKINLGLHITEKRTDGYHNIETILYPIPLKDALEAVISNQLSFTQIGLKLNTPERENLVMKAHAIMAKNCSIPPLEIYLHKAIPVGSGLGGGSADAAFALKLINKLCKCRLSDDALEMMAASVGADCPFFIRNTPVLATGTGTVLSPIELSLKGYFIYVVKPPVSISTKEMYGMLKPRKPEFQLERLSSLPVSEWKDVLVNDFESVIIKQYPVIRQIKEKLYALGAEYASITGSGSALFGLFNQPVSHHFPYCFVWKRMIR